MTGLAAHPLRGQAGLRAARSAARAASTCATRSDGRHVEADLTRQVLAEIEPGGRVRTIYTMSSGKPSTPTVIGRFRVYQKTPGVNSEGMVDSNYFIRGYAIHGYAEVPTYAASHGCLRVPIPDAPRSTHGCRKARRWTSTTKAAAAATTSALTPVRSVAHTLTRITRAR